MSSVRPSVSYARTVPVSEVILPLSVMIEPDRVTRTVTFSPILSPVFQMYCFGLLHILLILHLSFFSIFIEAISVSKSLSDISYLISHISYLTLSSLTTWALVRTVDLSIQTHMPRTTSLPSRVQRISTRPSLNWWLVHAVDMMQHNMNTIYFIYVWCQKQGKSKAIICKQ